MNSKDRVATLKEQDTGDARSYYHRGAVNVTLAKHTSEEISYAHLRRLSFENDAASRLCRIIKYCIY